jgi:hypothetical protein
MDGDGLDLRRAFIESGATVMTDGAKHSVIDFVGTCGTRVSFRLACPIAHVLLYGNLVRNDSDIALLERSYEWSVSTNLEKALSSSKLSQRNPWYGTPITINEPEIRKAVAATAATIGVHKPRPGRVAAMRGVLMAFSSVWRWRSYQHI